MTRAKITGGVVLVVLALAGSSAAQPPGGRGIVVLVTPEEAGHPDAPALLLGGAERAVTDGPGIEIVTPQKAAEYRRPIDIRVDFKPQGAPVDFETLKVTYVKLFNIDITDRVKPFASAAGIRLERADLPSGNHTVRVSIADTRERESSATFTVKIVDP